jgi:hypothetical protein
MEIKSTKNEHMVKVLDYEVTREGFTNHGLHLNSTGKSKIAQLITQHIITSENNFHNPIPMQWRETSGDLNHNRCKPSTLIKDHLTSDNKERSDNPPTLHHQDIRKSNRTKKLP